jgi:predicted polyphosphate/ATP-dependent NAD kinase
VPAPSAPAPIGIIANPVSGKDIRRLVANAPTSTLQEKYTIVRRAVIGAAAAGARRFWFLPEPHKICERAVETLHLDGVTYDRVPLEERFDESDTVRTVAKMRELGVGVVIVLGGDGTNRAAALGWPDVPVIPLSTGTNNVFPRFVEATVAGEAAGLVAAGHVGLDEVSRRAKVVHVDVDGEAVADGATGAGAGRDLALIDAVLVDERFVGSRALFDPAALRLALLTRAEPAAVGISSIGGLVSPCGEEIDGGVLLRFADPNTAGAGAAGTGRVLRAPMAPGWYATVGLDEVRRVGLDEPVTVDGPGILAFDGERQRLLRAGERAVLRVRRDGPRVIDVGATLRLAAERASFVDDAPAQAHGHP